MVFADESVSSGLHRRHTVAPPLFNRHSAGAIIPSRSSIGKSRATSALLRHAPWPNMGAPYFHLGHSSCRFYCSFTRWSYGGETNYAGRATVILRNKPALFRSPMSPVFFKPHHGTRRFNTVYPDSTCCSSRRCYGCGHGWPRCSNWDAPGLKTGTVWTRQYSWQTRCHS